MIDHLLPEPRFVILMSGPIDPGPRLAGQIAGARAIAADSGMRHAARLRLRPELWVGDFDSSGDELQRAWREVPREPYSSIKNETDGEIAVEAALARGAGSLILAGSLGGDRSDHALSHIVQALALHERGIAVLMTSGTEEAAPLCEAPRRYDLPGGCLFSIVVFGEMKRLTIEGARYSLDDHHVTFGATRTISNVANGPVTIAHGGGRGLLVARPYDFSGA